MEAPLTQPTHRAPQKVLLNTHSESMLQVQCETPQSKVNLECVTSCSPKLLY
jgi:hypothetical protein